MASFKQKKKRRPFKAMKDFVVELFGEFFITVIVEGLLRVVLFVPRLLLRLIRGILDGI